MSKRRIVLIQGILLYALIASAPFFLCSADPPKVNKDSLALATADWNWKKTDSRRGSNVEYGYAKINMFGGIQSIAIVRYPSGRCKTAIIDAEGAKASSTSNIAIGNKAIAAINGSYFDMKKLVPVTYIKVDGKVLGKTVGNDDSRTNGIVAVKGRCGHGISIHATDSAIPARANRFRSAIASGPMLLENGEMIQYAKGPKDGFFSKRHPRTILGYDDKGMVYMIVVDGRSAGNADGMTIAELSETVHYLGLKEAINLDGGGSSTLWTNKSGVINHPSDNGKFDAYGERKVPNIIIAK